MIVLDERTRVYCVGIKGTGMAALAEYCRHSGADVSGSDVEEVFYTDAILKELSIPVYAPFSVNNLPPEVDYLFYSAAYDPSTHPELVAARKRGIPLYSYPEALGEISAARPTAAVAGVHGKTTTTALAGSIAQAVGLPTGVIVGSAVGNFGNRCCLFLGDRALIAETCEYRRHFLHVSPRWLIVTSIEADHLDYYTDYDDVFSAFEEYSHKINPHGALLYCADDPGALELAGLVERSRPDIKLISYGFSPQSDFTLSEPRVENERLCYRIEGVAGLIKLRIPGRHTALDAAAAVLLCRLMADDLDMIVPDEKIVAGIESFIGSKRRSEIIGEAEGILFMDDYAHHPTALKTTLEGLRSFYPQRRLVVDFMSHTYSRTEALLDGFAAAFDAADILILHKIYASAREQKGSIDGRTLYERTAKQHQRVQYIHDPSQSMDEIDAVLQPGDLFITMGAGNNWTISHELYSRRKAAYT